MICSRRILRLLLLLILVLASLPVGVVSAADPIAMRFLTSPVSTLDPISVPRSDSGGRDLIENLFIGLTRYDPASNQIVPALARSWQVSDDGLTWTFALRSDIKWIRYNPTTKAVEAVRPVVAGDFVYSLRRACDPQPPNPEAHSMYIIQGCRAIATTNPQLITEPFISQTLAVQAVKDDTLQITLVFPALYFPSLLALPEFRPVPQESISQSDDNWTMPGVLLSDGPWILTDWQVGQQMSLIHNPYWPDPVTGNVEQISVSFASDASSAVQALIGGTTDVARLDPFGEQAVKQAKPDLPLIMAPQSVVVLGFSAERSPLTKDDFRRALSFAIDRTSLVAPMGDAAVPTSRFTPPGIIGGPTTAPDNTGFNPDEAKSALVASGLINCKLPTPLVFAFTQDDADTALVQALIAQWTATLGCRKGSFTLKPSTADYVQSIAHAGVTNIDPAQNVQRPHLWLTTWTPDYADANAWLADALHCQNGFQRTGIACGDADTLVDSASLESDSAKRADDYSNAEDIWFGAKGRFPVAPLYILMNVVGTQPGVKGVFASGAARFDLWIK